MDDIQRAIEQFQKEIETLNKMPVNVSKLEDVVNAVNARETAISAMQELQAYRATGLTPHMVETLKESDKRSHQLAVQRAAELDEYWAIGTPEKCREAVKRQQECKNCGYKIHGERISKLHDCNDCGRKNNCSIRPAYGKYCRINCHAWTAEDKNGKIDGKKTSCWIRTRAGNDYTNYSKDWNVINKLAELEDLQESGRMIIPR